MGEILISPVPCSPTYRGSTARYPVQLCKFLLLSIISLDSGSHLTLFDNLTYFVLHSELDFIDA